MYAYLSTVQNGDLYVLWLIMFMYRNAVVDVQCTTILIMLYYTLKGQFKFASESDVLLTEHDKKVWQLQFM